MIRLTKYENKFGMAGLGTIDPQTGQIIGVASTAAATAGGLIATLAPSLAIAGPIGAAVAGALAIGTAIANLFSGCGEACVYATKVVDQAAPLLQQNKDQYLALPRPHTVSMQAAYLKVFDDTFAQVIKLCGNSQLGDAGVRCIEERMPQGMTVGNYVGNGRYNWYAYYRDPIANDDVVPDATLASSASNVVGGISQAMSSVISGSGSGLFGLLLGGIGIVAALYLLSSNEGRRKG